MTDDPAFADATETLKQLRRGELSSRDLLENYLDRIERHEWVNAVVTVDADHARAQASAADAARRTGIELGPLHGLPITVKHDLEVGGMLSTYGSTYNRDHVASRDAESVARLRRAGAIVFGRTNLPEFASDGQSYNELHGVTRNPWDSERTPGGSSGGSAAAVAAGMTGLCLGSDLGGSIRIPAAWCGVPALKPSWGVVPTTGSAPTPGPAAFEEELLPEDVAVSGPLARSVADLALALDVLTSKGEGRVSRRDLPASSIDPTRPLRVAAWFNDARSPTSAATLRVLEDACRDLQKAGVEVVGTTTPGLELDRLEELFELMFMSDLVGHVGETSYREIVAGFVGADDWMSRVHYRAATLSHRDWLALEAERNGLRRAWADLFRDVDVLITPVVPTTALAHDHSEPVNDRVHLVDGVLRPWRPYLTRWCGAIGVAGLPAVSVPVGLDAANLPVGMQVVGPLYGDRTVLAAAAVIERICGGYRIPPAVAR
ncbi:MAG: amidase family protein [Lacisediminihabitans sp.]